MNDAPITNVVRADRCIVNTSRHMQLVVTELGGCFVASIERGVWPYGSTIVSFSFKLSEAWVVATEEDGFGIWMGATKVYLSWRNLLKVADYLQLPIPLPHPLPGDVQPAGEAT